MLTERQRLRRILDAYMRAEDCDPSLTELEVEAFADMAYQLDVGRAAKLSEKQERWLSSAEGRMGVDIGDVPKVLWESGLIPEGRPVETPQVLKTLPKKPPSRRSA